MSFQLLCLIVSLVSHLVVTDLLVEIASFGRGSKVREAKF